MQLSKNIRRLRTAARLSQEALGERLGVSGQAVSKWEQGATAPDVSLLPALADCFGVTIDALFDGTATPRHFGYGNPRGEWQAAYMHKDGTEDDFRRAADAFAQVLLNGEPEIEDYLGYAELYARRSCRDAEIAIRYYRKALAEGEKTRGVDWMRAHQELTNALNRSGRGAEAVAEMRAWAEKEPESHWAHVSLAYALEREGRLEEALTEIERALAIEREDANVRQEAGDLCARLGRYEEAFMHWDEAYRLMPESIACLFSKAAAYEALNRVDQAIRQYEEILDWLKSHGYDLRLEGEFPNARLAALKESR